MLYQWFPGLPETAFGTHDSHGRCQGASPVWS